MITGIGAHDDVSMQHDGARLPPVFAAIVLAGLVLTAGLSGMLEAGGAAAPAAMSLLWLVVNAPMEGPVLVTFTPAHGVTGADLDGFVGLVLAGYRALLLTRRARDRI